MKKWLKQYSGILYILAATVVLAAILLFSNEMPAMINSLGQLNVKWVWMSAGTIVMYYLVRAITLYYYLRRQKCPLKFREALYVTGVGQFYSAITPSSSGGQPMQVFSMHKKGVPVSVATATVSVKYIGFQLAFLLMGGVLWVFNRSMVAEQLGSLRWLVALGYVINVLLVVLVVMTIFRSAFVNRIVSGCVSLGVKLYLIKHREEALEKALVTLDEYRRGVQEMFAHPLDGLVILLLSLLQIFFLMNVGVCLYRAFGLTGSTAGQIMTIQLLLFISAAFVPLPGAAGAQEGGFYLFFRGIFPENNLMAAMLCWRLFSYYQLMGMGMLAIVFESVERMIRERKKGKSDV